ncbi:hypothetical protein PIB30_005624 [Stylosanthes scabra]|uniref:Uncharacterized protein n=1 Tax=Stylosanthes scabra TaxID=79078 RepID=A0ABU6S3G7_9FABA|nr:hypothetical protein [Stylosanthes scabra]
MRTSANKIYISEHRHRTYHLPLLLLPPDEANSLSSSPPSFFFFLHLLCMCFQLGATHRKQQQQQDQIKTLVQKENQNGNLVRFAVTMDGKDFSTPQQKRMRNNNNKGGGSGSDEVVRVVKKAYSVFTKCSEDRPIFYQRPLFHFPP